MIKPKSKFSFGFDELFQYRELLYFFTWKEIKIRYKQALLGVLWTILQPLTMMAIFTVLLSNGLGLSTGNMPATLYYFSGILIWNLFNQAVTYSAQSMVSNANIIRKIYFPRLVIPISAVLTASFDFLISIIIFLGIVSYYDFLGTVDVDWMWLLLHILLAYIITIFTSFSLGTFLSSFNVKYRDVRYVLPFLVQTLFFLTPVMYDATKIQSTFIRKIIELNPLCFAIESIRYSFDSNALKFPELSIFVVVIIIVLYFMAIYTFRKTEAYFADII